MLFAHKIDTDAIALVMVTENGADVAELKLLSAAFVAVIAQVADTLVAERMCSFPPTIEHAVEEPTANDSAPVPDPPLVTIVASGSPKVNDDGAVTDNAA